MKVSFQIIKLNCSFIQIFMLGRNINLDFMAKCQLELYLKVSQSFPACDLIFCIIIFSMIPSHQVTLGKH